MEIKVLGPGCSRCKATYRVVEKVVRELGLDVQLSKVEDVVEMMRWCRSKPKVVGGGVRNRCFRIGKASLRRSVAALYQECDS